MKPVLLYIFCVITFLPAAHADSTLLAVGTAKTKQAVLGLMTLEPKTGASLESAYANSLFQTMESDFKFLKLFSLFSPEEFPQKSVSGTNPVQSEPWMTAGVDYLSYGSVTKQSTGKISVDFHVYSIAAAKDLLSKNYLAEADDLKALGHTLADDLVMAITGKKGIFQTRITMICDRSGKKEVFTMNYDGSDLRQITQLRSLAMAPAWNPSGTQIAFSVFTKHSNGNKNLDLFLLDLRTGKQSLLSNRTGINSGATFHPNGKDIALTLSFLGNPEIFLLNSVTKEATQLTKSLGFDVDPKFSPDGTKIAFVSSRPGKPMIYVMPKDQPSAAKRITYAGQYNATPSWLPDSKRLAFAGWIDRHFDLFVINTETQQIDRLTKNEGNNEDPSVSPDGNFIVFTSNRESGKNIWITSMDGKFIKRLTFGAGSCSAPQWSPYL
jgi:TolB protein